MDFNLLEHFAREIEVEYRGEHYAVRDDGSVCRQRRPEHRKRKLDDVWTFGNANASTGYFDIASEVVHRIVATAFHGAQPSEKHVVDHIDTNRKNNRPENLRWITRLDNLLLNPITLRRIVIAYGSIDAFFANPSAPTEVHSTTNFEWMRTVSKEEAEESRDRIMAWAESGKIPKGGQLGEWVYSTKQPAREIVVEDFAIQSLTDIALQRNWKTPSEFPMCPDEIGDDPLDDYSELLTFGTVFSRNSFGESLTVVAETSGDTLSVVCNLAGNPIKDWALSKVFIENGKFCHESVRTYFTLQGAMKEHCGLLGIPLDDSIDDYS